MLQIPLHNATLTEDQRERCCLGYLEKTFTYTTLWIGEMTLGKSYTPPNNVLLELGDVHSEHNIPDRGGQTWERVMNFRKMVRKLESTTQCTKNLQKLYMGYAFIGVKINQSMNWCNHFISTSTALPFLYWLFSFIYPNTTYLAQPIHFYICWHIFFCSCYQDQSIHCFTIRT